MIDFLIAINKLLPYDETKICKEHEFNLNKEKLGNTLVLFNTTRYYSIKEGKTTYIFIGDVITDDISLSEVDYLKKIIKGFNSEVIRKIKGFFYLIKVENSHIEVYNSLFSILPLFYFEGGNNLLISSRISLMKLVLDKFDVNRNYIIEKLLFNYGFLNNTLFKDIKLVPSNTFIRIKNNRFVFEKHTNIIDFFVNSPVSKNKTIHFLADIFVDNAKKYFPKEKASIAFTGGFDGRTLVSVAKASNIDFMAYSFGIESNDDLSIPMTQSDLLGIDFKPFFLNDQKYYDSFLNDGNELIKLSSGQSSFLYTHFLYSSRLLSQHSKYVLTGYFGSELNRSLNVAGAVTSRKLIDLLIYDEENWRERILLSPRLEFLNKEFFKNELTDVINIVQEYKNSLSNDLTLNQKFYTYIFEETFRKMFGAIITAQMNYQFVRSPFLDFDFIKELLKTSFAGVNNTFITTNPFKRLKGQKLYAEIIKNTNPDMLVYKTGKGYSPKDLLSIKGHINILAPFVLKRFKRVIKKTDLDNLQLLSNFFYNRKYFGDRLDKTDYFNNDMIKYKLSEFLKITNEVERDMIIFCVSMNENIIKR